MRRTDHLASSVAALAILLLTAAAWSVRFIQDDAYISFVYARNLAEGRGLTWIDGEAVEGYTNFLWVMLMALPELIGRHPAPFAIGLGLLSFALALAATWLLARRALGSPWMALVAMLIAGTNASFLRYASGGLETMTQTLLGLGLLLAAVRLIAEEEPRRVGPALAISLLAALALLTRLDSAVLVAAAGGAALVHLWRRAGAARAAQIGWLLGPAALIVGVWLGWKLATYGSILPNTFHAKVGMGGTLKYGVFYVYLFFMSYWLIPLPLILLGELGRLRRERPALRLAAGAAGLWLAYVALVGGDFMEFRFIVPAIPLLAILIVWLLFFQIRQQAVRHALLAMVLLGSLHHAATFHGWGGVERMEVESVRELASHLRPGGTDWIGIGERLGELFGGEDVMLATGVAGSIPYYSRLETIDIFGLNDAWIARNGLALGQRPGHRRLASFDYLRARGVNLMLGDPNRVARAEIPSTAAGAEDLRRLYVHDAEPGEIWPDARLVYIPLTETEALEALYMTYHPAIESAIEAQGWPTRAVRLPR